MHLVYLLALCDGILHYQGELDKAHSNFVIFEFLTSGRSWHHKISGGSLQTIAVTGISTPSWVPNSPCHELIVLQIGA